MACVRCGVGVCDGLRTRSTLSTHSTRSTRNTRSTHSARSARSTRLARHPRINIHAPQQIMPQSREVHLQNTQHRVVVSRGQFGADIVRASIYPGEKNQQISNYTTPSSSRRHVDGATRPETEPRGVRPETQIVVERASLDVPKTPCSFVKSRTTALSTPCTSNSTRPACSCDTMRPRRLGNVFWNSAHASAPPPTETNSTSSGDCVDCGGCVKSLGVRTSVQRPGEGMGVGGLGMRGVGWR